MKRILKLFIIVLPLVCLQGCQKWLEATSSSQISGEQLFSDRAGFHEALSGVYMLMGSTSCYGRNYTWFVNELTASPLIPQNGNIYQQLQNQKYTNAVSFPYFESMWESGYNVIASIVPEKANQTLVVSYGYTGLGRYHTSGIIIQMRDAETQKLVASFEAEGYGDSGNEAVGITRAIYKALDWFTYYSNPKIVYKVIDEYRNYIYLDLYNYTPSHVSQVTLFVSYYKDGELVHEQEVEVATNINPSEQQRIYFKRPKEFRSKKLKIRYNVISYK